MNLGEAHIIQGNALNLPLPDSSVDLICTSPPYFGLRSYQDGGQHYDGQIGSEATPAEFLDALIAATREMVRVLKPSGSIFVNLGDKYAGGAGDQGGKGRRPDTDGYGYRYGKSDAKNLAPTAQSIKYEWGGIRPKSLMGIPWRYAIRCIDELGLILRAEIIWAKPNGLPESVTDRVRRSHEQWFHLVCQPRYFAAVDEIRETTNERATVRTWEERKAAGVTWTPGQGTRGNHLGKETAPDTSGFANNPLGKLPGSVWSVPTQPLTVPPELGIDHFAAYPMEWSRRIIQGWTPNGICTECGFLLGSSYDNGVLGVRRTNNRRTYQTGTRAETSTEDEQVLFEEMLQSSHGTEQSLNQIPPTDNTRLRGGIQAGSPDGAEVGLPNGASLDHGEPPRPHAGAVRGSASPQRDKDGQPDREPRATGQDRTRQAPQTSTQTVRMSSLRRYAPDLRNSQPCPHCGGTSFRPSVILDNFGGTGTTALVAKALGRTGITVDLSNDYCRLAEWRTNDPRELAAALQIEKPEPVHPDQLDLFSETL